MMKIPKSICDELKAAIKDEETGVKSYKYLQNELERQGLMKESKMIGRIATTEAGHKKKVQRIYNKLCREVI
jgi:rubrerythrin